jgi:hypothetical protein
MFWIFCSMSAVLDWQMSSFHSLRRATLAIWYCKLAASCSPKMCSQVDLNRVFLEPSVLFPSSQFTILDMFDVVEHCVAWTILVYLRGYQALALAYPLVSANNSPVIVPVKQNEPMTFVSQIPHHTIMLSASCCLLPKTSVDYLSSSILRFCLLTSSFTYKFLSSWNNTPCKKFLFCLTIQNIDFNQFHMVPDFTEILFNCYASLFFKPLCNVVFQHPVALKYHFSHSLPYSVQLCP